MFPYLVPVSPSPARRNAFLIRLTQLQHLAGCPMLVDVLDALDGIILPQLYDHNLNVGEFGRAVIQVLQERAAPINAVPDHTIRAHPNKVRNLGMIDVPIIQTEYPFIVVFGWREKARLNVVHQKRGWQICAGPGRETNDGQQSGLRIRL